MKFSDRMEITDPQDSIQKEEISEGLRNRLYSVYAEHLLETRSRSISNSTRPSKSYMEVLCEKIWDEFFKEPTQDIPTLTDDIVRTLRKVFEDEPWWKVYNLIELSCSVALSRRPDKYESFTNAANEILEEENSAYRITDQQVVPITDDVELDSIEEAMENAQGKYQGARNHLSTSLNHLSENNYRDSIKESISAVETMAKVKAGDQSATLGQVIQGIGIEHEDLREGLKKLYHWTSDEEGVRHAMIEEPNIDSSDAKYMLVTCSAFVNYLIEKETS